MIRKLRYFILTVAIGLMSHFEASGRQLAVTTVGGRDCYVYEVEKGESIYDVSKALGVPTIEITRYNPSAADGLRQGMRLYVPVAIVSAEGVQAQPVQTTPSRAEQEVVPTVAETAPPGDDSDTYTVKRNETLYGISRKVNMSMEELIALNPSAENGVKQGDVLRLKSAGTEAAAPVEAQPDIFNRPIDYSLAPSEERITRRDVVPVHSEVALNDEGEQRDTVNMAVILPFMLHSGSGANKNSQLFLEFYKGLLLAADTLKSAPGNFVNIYAYDSAASIDTVAAIMRRAEMADMNVIIGPDNDAQLRLIAAEMGSGTHLYNTFNVRSTLSSENTNVIQANIQHTQMLDKAANAFLDMYEAYTPIFMSRIDGAADKDAFVTLLKQKLQSDSVAFEEITFRNLLSHRDLERLPTDRNYVFVPISGARAEFAKLSEAIHHFGLSRPGQSTRIFGYPDWIVFRGEYFNRLGELEATIYSRFYADMKQPEVVALSNKFKRTYGAEMLDAAPVQGLLGFDTGMFLIGALKENGAEFADNLEPYIGLQSVMNIVDSPAAGAVNDALLIVTFTPSGSTIKTTLE